MTDHPLTETEAVELWEERCGYRFTDNTLAALRAAFDAGSEHERTNPEDARPWEPLNGPVRVGDEVRRDHCGIIVTGVVARVDEDGDPWTAEDYLIGLREYGTWYVRRTVQELPTDPGSVIVPADGHEHITATRASETWHARDAVLVCGQWHAAWRTHAGRWIGWVTPKQITPGTWKVDGQ